MQEAPTGVCKAHKFLHHCTRRCFLQMPGTSQACAPTLTPDRLDGTFRINDDMKADFTKVCTDCNVSITMRVPFPKPHNDKSLYLSTTCTAGIADTSSLMSMNTVDNETHSLTHWAKQLYGTTSNGRPKRTLTSSMYVLIDNGTVSWYVGSMSTGCTCTISHVTWNRALYTKVFRLKAKRLTTMGGRDNAEVHITPSHLNPASARQGTGHNEVCTLYVRWHGPIMACYFDVSHV